MEDRLEAVLEGQDRVDQARPETRSAAYFYRSDHISLAKKGVPMLYADGGPGQTRWRHSRGQGGADAYTARRYHKPMDEYAMTGTFRA